MVEIGNVKEVIKDVDFDGDKVWEYFHMNN